MRRIVTIAAALFAAWCGYGQTLKGVVAEAEVKREVVADDGISDALAPLSDAVYEYMVNGEPMDENEADIRVRPWNVKRIRAVEEDGHTVLRIRAGRMSKHFLKGNVCGMMWDGKYCDDGCVRRYISRYILLSDYDSIRKAEGYAKDKMFSPSRKHWRPLSENAVYLLNGKPIAGSALIYLEGAILQKVDLRFRRRDVRRFGPDAAAGVVRCRTYRKRMPLILIDGERATLRQWLAMCDPKVINMGTQVNYRTLSPIDGYKRYGRAAKYGVLYVLTREAGVE